MKFTQVFLLLFLISTYAFPFQTKKSSTSFELGSLAFENQKWAEAQSYFTNGFKHILLIKKPYGYEVNPAMSAKVWRLR